MFEDFDKNENSGLKWTNKKIRRNLKVGFDREGAHNLAHWQNLGEKRKNQLFE